jgi:hypothetical protein
VADPRAVPTNVELDTASGGGLSTYRNLDVGTSGANVKSSAGRVYGYYFANRATAWRYLKLYDKATAPVVGTDTPKMTLPLPPESAGHVPFPQGVEFANGIGVGATTGLADTDTGAPTANDVVLNLFYA